VKQPVIETIDAALRAVDQALTSGMRTISGAPATPHLERLRDGLLAMRAGVAVDPVELRAMIRAVADWTPELEVTLLSALGAVARASSSRTAI
jgi:hypothetical protein